MPYQPLSVKCSGAVALSDVMKIVEECLNNNDEESLRNAFKVSDLFDY